jgi:hypothetical protein
MFKAERQSHKLESIHGCHNLDSGVLKGTKTGYLHSVSSDCQLLSTVRRIATSILAPKQIGWALPTLLMTYL